MEPGSFRPWTVSPLDQISLGLSFSRNISHRERSHSTPRSFNASPSRSLLRSTSSPNILGTSRLRPSILQPAGASHFSYLRLAARTPVTTLLLIEYLDLIVFDLERRDLLLGETSSILTYCDDIVSLQQH